MQVLLLGGNAGGGGGGGRDGGVCSCTEADATICIIYNYTEYIYQRIWNKVTIFICHRSFVCLMLENGGGWLPVNLRSLCVFLTFCVLDHTDCMSQSRTHGFRRWFRVWRPSSAVNSLDLLMLAVRKSREGELQRIWLWTETLSAWRFGRNERTN